MADQRWLNRAARYGVAALLTVVACRQLYLAHRHDLSSWLGGGMGMFATIDRPTYRATQVWLTGADGREIGVDPNALGSIRPAETRAKLMPSESRMAEFVQALIEARWTLEPSDGAAEPAMRPCREGEEATFTPTAVRVRVCAVEFDPTTRVASLRVLRERRLAAPGAVDGAAP